MRRPRCIAVLKWTGLSLCVLIFPAWFASGWFYAQVLHVDHRGNLRVLGLGSGSMVFQWGSVTRDSRSAPAGWYPEARWSNSAGWRWRPKRERFGGMTTARVPLYVTLVLLVGPTAWLFCRDRRSVRWAREGRCVRCGYDRAGLAAGSPCPECES